MCAGSSINWRSKRQTVVAQSSQEAEFIALYSCVSDILWIRKFAGILEHALDKEVVHNLLDICIGEDNQAFIADARNPRVSDLSKHIDLKFQFPLDDVRKGNVKIRYLETENMTADMLTKNLGTAKFSKLI